MPISFPKLRSPSEILDEEKAGGWIPPCRLQIVNTDVIDILSNITDVGFP